MKADMTTELTDDALLHLKDTHVGDPTETIPLTNEDWINFARAAIYADRASRSRAASEPGEVARLAEEIRAGISRELASANGDALRRRELRLATDAAIDRLASMATSPASEAAGQALRMAVDRHMTVRFYFGSAVAQATVPGGPAVYETVENHSDPLAGACQAIAQAAAKIDAGIPELASTPQPASVAAEGQKAVAEWEHLKRYGYAPGNYVAKCRTCSKVMEFVDKRAITCRPCAEERHTASMADAAEAACPTGDPFCPCPDGDACHYEGKNPFSLPSPSQDGENAGGVVEALSEQQVGECIDETNASSQYSTHHFGWHKQFAAAIQRACATAWGLRIAEKGDAS